MSNPSINIKHRYNPKTKPREQGGGSTGRAGCGKPTNFKNSFSGSGCTPYSKPWCVCNESLSTSTNPHFLFPPYQKSFRDVRIWRTHEQPKLLPAYSNPRFALTWLHVFCTGTSRKRRLRCELLCLPDRRRRRSHLRRRRRRSAAGFTERDQVTRWDTKCHT